MEETPRIRPARRAGRFRARSVQRHPAALAPRIALLRLYCDLSRRLEALGALSKLRAGYCIVYDYGLAPCARSGWRFPGPLRIERALLTSLDPASTGAARRPDALILARRSAPVRLRARAGRAEQAAVLCSEWMSPAPNPGVPGAPYKRSAAMPLCLLSAGDADHALASIPRSHAVLRA